MYELLHTVEHAAGLCGEKHVSLLGFLLEYSHLNYTYSYIGSYIKFIQTKL